MIGRAIVIINARDPVSEFKLFLREKNILYIKKFLVYIPPVRSDVREKICKLRNRTGCGKQFGKNK